jgi:glycosyltransferase involved in cell wall biosynthesis
LAECLSSIQAQTIDDFECIVVDDGSNPPAAVPADSRFRLVRRPVGTNSASARNAGLASARGRYVTFLDDDDLYTPERLAIGLEGVEHAPVGLCWLGAVGQPADYVRHGFYEFGDVHDYALGAYTHQIGIVTLAREDVPLFDELVFASEDLDWWLTVSKQFHVHTVFRVGCLYRDHPGDRASQQLHLRKEDRLRMSKKHSDYFAAHPRHSARLWSKLSWQALFRNKPVLAAEFMIRAIRADPSIKGIRATLREVRISRQIALKVRGSFRKRISRRGKAG